ncbi:glycosyltransferase family A protein [Spongiimicrobium salis]|uniref:glycosyltransferase family A protein n=1 Tax=Spongiimicrobium salis TaxID=1667022 RepID=UPI00374D5B62
MLTFIIPVKSAKVSSSWDNFSKLFERSIKSVCNQTDKNFRVVVVCHEKPATNFEHPNLEYIHVDFSPPDLSNNTDEINNGLKEEDKSKKILFGIEYCKKYESDYLMVVDADDCISNTIVSFVNKNLTSKVPGWYFKQGYIFREGEKKIFLNKENFNTLCGTCIIIRPDLISDIFQNRPHIEYLHKTIELSNGNVLTPYPGIGAIYSMANGENHFMSTARIKNLNSKYRYFSFAFISSVFRKLRKYRPRLLSNAIISEFGLTKL